MLYTSRYFNPFIKTNLDKLTVVRISVGTPRFLPYKLAGYIKELAPIGYHRLTDKDEFKKRYIAQLEQVGVDKIAEELDKFEVDGKEIVLCCYEDVRKGGDNWCHRMLFAQWWHQQTGDIVDEVYDPTKFKLELSDTPFMDILNGFV